MVVTRYITVAAANLLPLLAPRSEVHNQNTMKFSLSLLTLTVAVLAGTSPSPDHD